MNSAILTNTLHGGRRAAVVLVLALHRNLNLRRAGRMTGKMRMTIRGIASSLTMLLAVPACAWFCETPFEFQGDADLDGDGNPDVVIVDKSTGAFRVGYQTAPGVPVWADARASGVTDVSGVNAGRLLSLTRDGLAVVSPGANRVALIEAPSAAAAIAPAAVFLPSLGPNAVAAVDIGGAGNTGHDDLYVPSRENPGLRETLLRNTGASQSVIVDQLLAAVRTSPNRFQLKSGQPQRVGLFNRLGSGGNDQLAVLDFQTGVASLLFTQSVPLGNTPEPPQFVAARFAAANAYAQILAWRPGSNTVLNYQVTEPVVGTFGLVPAVNFNLGQPIQGIALVPGSSDTRLLVLFGPSASNATVATLFSFDGTNAPVPVQSHTNASGFAGGAALNSGNLALFGSDGSGRSTTYQVKLRSGAGYVDGAAGDLPAATPYSGHANVLLMNAEPFVNPAARPLRLVRAREWSSAPVLSGGAPPAVTVRGETFGGLSNGLFNAGNVSLGTAPVGTTHALVNQYSNVISVFSLQTASGDQPGRVSVSPPPGEYPSAIQVSLAATPGSWGRRYRLAPGVAWQNYSGPVTIFSNTIFQCYAFDPGSSAKTAIESVAYQFSTASNSIDSDNDGIPDAVESFFGLNPRGGKDSDGDGRSDLEEIVRGTNPLLASSVSTNFPRLDVRGDFDRVVIPLPPDSSGAATLAATGTIARAWTVNRVFQGGAITTNQFLPGVPPSAARFTIVPGDGEMLTLETTENHYALANTVTTQRFGRELVGFVRVPPYAQPALPPLDPSLSPAAIQSWLFAASNLLVNLPQPLVRGDLTPRSSMVALLLERRIAETLLARGTNGGTNLTAFPFRTPDVNRTPIDGAILSAVEAYAGPGLPAYRAEVLFDFFEGNVQSNAAPESAALRAVANELWRVSAAHHDPNTNVLRLPFDAARRFVNTGVLEPGYAAFFTQGSSLATAFGAIQNLIAAAPPRPTSNFIVQVVAAGAGVPTTFRIAGTATPVTLWAKGGIPCTVPQGFELAPGSELSVFGFTDVPEAPGTVGLEVITLGLASVPVVSAGDLNGNLLPDAWENAFFGGAMVDPFADDDGDAKGNLQEMLDGTDPNNPANFGGGSPVNFNSPVLEISAQGGGSLNEIFFEWPAAYIGNFNFSVKTSESVDGLFTDVPVGAPQHVGGSRFKIVLSSLPAVQRFYLVNVSLR